MVVKRRTTRGVTILEVLMAIFVLLIGVTGVMALFPVGVHLSQQSADDILSAMTVQNALAAVRVQPGLRNRIQAYVAGQYDDGDVLAWTGSESTGVDGHTGCLESPTESNPDRVDVSSVSGGYDEMFDVKHETTTAAVKADNCALLLLTSGKAEWKLYRLDAHPTAPDYTSYSPTRFASVANGYTDFLADGILNGETYRLVGARNEGSVWATVPAGFYDPADGYELGTGAAAGYGYLAIVTRRKNNPDTVRIDILVYKGYDKTLPPEGNLPAVACYTTYWSMGMLDATTP